MIDENSLCKLLRKIGSSLSENAGSNTEKDSGFNIFNVLGVSSKEVIICRFLGELLNPDGSHSMGHIPLLKFVNNVLEIEDFDESDAKYSEVLLEELTDESRRVDIAIHSGNRVFPIEAKIRAEDQNEQLSSYFKFYKSNSELERIFYLTPTGWEPSEKSRGQLQIGKEITCLSFEKNINEWIDSLISECKNESEKIIMRQFVEVINKMCAESRDFYVIKKELGLTLDKYEYTSEIKAALEIIKQGDEIKKLIRELHLMKHIKLNTSKYELSADIKEGEPDKHVVMKIVTKTDGKTVAWLCVHKNLYLVAKKVKDLDKWSRKSNPDGEYIWQYVFPEGKQTPYDMKDINNFVSDNRPLNIDNLLNDVDMTENDSNNKGE